MEVAAAMVRQWRYGDGGRAMVFYLIVWAAFQVSKILTVLNP